MKDTILCLLFLWQTNLLGATNASETSAASRADREETMTMISMRAAAQATGG
ncbi:hypothetical protein ABOZ73_06970 [Caulobacter sp. 73W]|uniref:Uncharacterized protein n=1 Tax=Caulobacter sp. 73W TaxID=3161137 RepID=A0AB39KWJ3_9CAUL